MDLQTQNLYETCKITDSHVLILRILVASGKI